MQHVLRLKSSSLLTNSTSKQNFKKRLTSKNFHHKSPTRSTFRNILSELPEENPLKFQKQLIQFVFKRNYYRNQNRNSPSSSPKTPLPSPSSINKALLVVALCLAGLYVVSRIFMRKNKIDWTTFRREYLESDAVKEIVLTNDMARIELFTGEVLFMDIPSADEFEAFLIKEQDELGFEFSSFIPVRYETRHIFGEFIGSVLYSSLFVVFLAVLVYFRGSMMSGGSNGIMNFTKSRHKKGTSKVKFKDVAGLGEAKNEVSQFVDYLKNPKKYKKLGAKIPRGALLTGPPGTGKTLLAKATAGEAQVDFFTLSGSDFVEMFVGVGPARVRQLFQAARKSGKPAIIFIDELDAIGGKRSKRNQGNDERENTLNQLLVEMDGFETSDNVIVFAATNRAETLDPALTRPGRFDRTINIDAPDVSGRKEILQVHMIPLKLNNSIEWFSEKVSTLTPGMSGADLANVCNESALIAAREDAKEITLLHFEKAIDRIIGGIEKKNRTIEQTELKTIAYHEAGHAVVGWFLEHADPLLKVSIVPRGKALGYAQYQPKERNLYTEEQLLDMMCVMLGGRLSELVNFNVISTGASDDLEKVTGLAYDQISRYGFSKALHNISYKRPQSGFPEPPPFSENTSRIIDDEVRNLVNRAIQRTHALILEHKDHIIAVGERLLKHEKITKDDLVEILGERPWKEIRTYEEIIADSKNDEDEEESKEKEKSV